MILELPVTQQQGKEAMRMGRALAGPGCPEGFTFNPFEPGSSESENFLIGCREVAFTAFH